MSEEEEQEAKNRWANSYARKQEAKKEKKRARNSVGHVPAMTQMGPASMQALRGDPLAPVSLVDDMVVVSMAVYEITADLMTRSVKSILAQTHQNLRLVMVSDGEAKPSWSGLSTELLNDPRVVRVVSPVNEGPYYNHDAVLRATENAFFAIQDADDESVPSRIQKQLNLLLATRSDACFSPVVNVRMDGTRSVVRPNLEVDDVFAHRIDHFGVYNPVALQEIGGYHGGFKVGFDSLVTSSLALLGRTCATGGEALYFRHARSSSLTNSPATGLKSNFRESQKSELRQFWNAVTRFAKMSPASGAQKQREISGMRVRAKTAQRTALVAEISAALAAIKVPRPAASEALIRAALAIGKDLSGPQEELVRTLFRFCESTTPRVLVEAGASSATPLLALYVARTPGVTLTVLEHDSERANLVRTRLAAASLAGPGSRVEVRLAPAKAFTRKPRGYTWYDTSLGDKDDVEFVFTSAEREGVDTEGLVWHHAKSIRSDAKIWIHDPDREKRGGTTRGVLAVQQWRQERQVGFDQSTKDLLKVEVR